MVAAGNHNFKTIVIDTVDNAFKYCSDHVNAKHNVEYEGDLGHGKGWAFVKNEWHRVLTRLASLPYGLVLISHAVDKRIETRTGEYTKTQPSLPDRARQVVLGLVDMILYCDTIPKQDANGNVTIERVIRTKPHPTYEAGDRTGRLPETLPLDYAAFAGCFRELSTQSGTVAIPHVPADAKIKESSTPSSKEYFSMTTHTNNHDSFAPESPAPADAFADQSADAPASDLSGFDDDYAGVEAPSYEEVLDGKYQVRVQRVELGASQKNDPMLKWDLVVISGPQAERHIFKNSVITHASLPFVKGDLQTLGLELPKFSDLPNHLDSLLDLTLEITRRTKGQYTNVYFNRRLNVPGGNARTQN